MHTVKEVAEELNIAPRTVRKYIALGKIDAGIVGKTYIISTQEVERMKEETFKTRKKERKENGKRTSKDLG